jgi:anoctamin-10/anoctamin-7
MAESVELTQVEPVMSANEPDIEFSKDFLMAMVFDAGTEGGGMLGLAQTPEKAEKFAARHILRMNHSGLKTFTYKSEAKTEIICLIGVADNKTSGFGQALKFIEGQKASGANSCLHKFADTINYPMLLDEKKCEELMKQGVSGVFEGRSYPDMDPDITTLRPFQYIYGRYESNLHDQVFVRSKPDDYPEDQEFNDDPFTDQIRIKLLYEFLRARKKDGGCGFRLTSLLRTQRLKGLYPLHNRKKADRLWDEYKMTCGKLCNSVFSGKFGNTVKAFDHVKSYFGEKIALYFNFISHLGVWLILPAILGAALNITVWASGNYSHWSLCFYSAIICSWSILMLEYWKRTEKEDSLRWGTLDFEKTETDRPEFKPDEMLEDFVYGELASDPHAKTMKWVVPAAQNRRFGTSAGVVMGMILLVIAVVAGIYVVRILILSEILGANASAVASVMNSMQIVIFNIIFTGICKTMTEYENQRTDTQYEDSLIGKLFFFQFVNSYSSFFFIAFVAESLKKPDYQDADNQKDWVGECGGPDCMFPLSVNVAIILFVRIGQNFANLILPWYSHKSAKASALARVGHLRFSPAEDEFLLTPYDPIHDSIQRYSDLAIQYGFMVLFTTALPLAALLVCIECFMSSQVDMYLLLNLKQRAMPAAASDMGTWMSVFQILSAFSIVTNGAIICFTMNVLDNPNTSEGLGWSKRSVMWFFIFFQWFFFTVQVIIEKLIPDVTVQTELQMQRMDFVVSKLIDGQKDEDDINDEDSDTDSDEESSNLAVKKHAKRSSLANAKFSDFLQDYPQVDANDV